jgi:hypothetical protein
MSKGAKELLEIVRKIYPNQRIILEHNVGRRLFLDIYLPSLGIGFEFDGEQHEKYIEHFHGDKAGFHASRKRDAEKSELCKELGIMLINMLYNEPITESAVRNKIIGELNGK